MTPTPTDLTALVQEARRHAASMREVQSHYADEKPIPANHLWIANTARIIEGLADALAALPREAPPALVPPPPVEDMPVRGRWHCSACGHRHLGEKFGDICVGCPCGQRRKET